jgi:hypothetical protein
MILCVFIFSVDLSRAALAALFHGVIVSHTHFYSALFVLSLVVIVALLLR